ncbi:hypothetical protein L1987_21249 [Smallanthus sonchifolius]|uniref:Uncharacterized protein n=1 Tax=Smallanthus sonchifolius TaxID=185202 RepID=A0ACB9IVJ0_9ASTR|nr:hypothetical protein L1987_21249 [Smallanthus sonchifolius]
MVGGCWGSQQESSEGAGLVNRNRLRVRVVKGTGGWATQLRSQQESSEGEGECWASQQESLEGEGEFGKEIWFKIS